MQRVEFRANLEAEASRGAASKYRLTENRGCSRHARDSTDERALGNSD